MEMTEKLKKLDRMYGQARLKEAEEALLQWLKEALMEGDTGAELAIYNELEGLYRTTKRAEEAVQISKKAISLAERMGLAGTAKCSHSQPGSGKSGGSSWAVSGFGGYFPESGKGWWI